MTTEVAVAVVSALAGITGSAIAWLQTVRTSRLRAETDIALESIRVGTEQLKADTTLAVEEIKLDTERRKTAFQLACQEAAPLEAALGQVWSDIQSVKETISKLLAPGEYHADAALASLAAAAERISLGYAEFGARLPAPARDAWHRAKGNAGAVHGLTMRHSPAGNTTPSLTPSAEQALRSLRDELGDGQAVLADALQGMRTLCVHRVLEVLS